MKAVAEATVEAGADGAALRERFERFGFVIVTGVLDAEARRGAQEACEELVQQVFARAAEEGIVDCADAHSDEPFEKRLMKLESLDHVPLLFRRELHQSRRFAELLLHKQVVGTVAELLPKVDELRIYPNYSARPKIPSSALHEVVWHQDAGLSPDGSPNTAPVAEREDAFGMDSIVNCWTPLVDANTENGCMLFIPGTHTLGIQTHVQLGAYRSDEAKSSEGGAEGDTIGKYKTTIDPKVLEPHLDRAVPIELNKGDVVFFSNQIFHRGGNNTSDHIRWSFDWRFQDAGKPTCRPESGHTVWSRTTDAQLSDMVDKWESLELS